jgi:hypothetical protein
MSFKHSATRVINEPYNSMMKTSGNERLWASAVNLAAIPFPYVGPIVGLAVAGNSKYVRFHAYRCLIEQIVSTIVIGFLMACSFGFSLYQLWKTGTFENGIDLNKVDWVAILVKGVVTWLLFALWGVWNTINSIRDALQANSGLLPKSPKWSERKALKLSGLMNSLSLADSSEKPLASSQTRV